MNGYYGSYGGMFVPEILVPVLEELAHKFSSVSRTAAFSDRLDYLLKRYAGRPTPLFLAENLSRIIGNGFRVYLKREDLLHTGAHKLNNTLGQVLLAKAMGKRRVIAETGAGQHGVATATAAALLGMECEVFMGRTDAERQSLNVSRMELLGAKVSVVRKGSMTLKDAINEAFRDFSFSFPYTHYVLGSALGPHPYPFMVREFQKVIGTEAKRQILAYEHRLPDCLVACVGGGSNSIGLFHPFLKHEEVSMIGVEAGGKGLGTGMHAARISGDGKEGVLHGCRSIVLQGKQGQIRSTHSVSAGLDYPAIGPEHAELHKSGRVSYVSATDSEALEAFRLLARSEGIIPALESAHAIAYLRKMAKHGHGSIPGERGSEKLIIVCLSGRGDKDVEQLKATKDNFK